MKRLMVLLIFGLAFGLAASMSADADELRQVLPETVAEAGEVIDETEESQRMRAMRKDFYRTIEEARDAAKIERASLENEIQRLESRLENEVETSYFFRIFAFNLGMVLLILVAVMSFIRRYYRKRVEVILDATPEKLVRNLRLDPMFLRFMLNTAIRCWCGKELPISSLAEHLDSDKCAMKGQLIQRFLTNGGSTHPKITIR